MKRAIMKNDLEDITGRYSMKTDLNRKRIMIILMEGLYKIWFSENGIDFRVV
ncbi:4934_t:CDS:2 [Acaulospora morrowiae]|uniref:4934_t:CDS:1 n=1 Tax=Acaulospora morrowiae TaxID=94023 RepID=A0A9N9A158_9GLOM|nr:4934_t:CDS:2 [Acaulospora morrowiae]